MTGAIHIGAARHRDLLLVVPVKIGLSVYLAVEIIETDLQKYSTENAVLKETCAILLTFHVDTC